MIDVAASTGSDIFAHLVRPAALSADATPASAVAASGEPARPAVRAPGMVRMATVFAG
jgi:hypothetical protein